MGDILALCHVPVSLFATLATAIKVTREYTIKAGSHDEKCKGILDTWLYWSPGASSPGHTAVGWRKNKTGVCMN